MRVHTELTAAGRSRLGSGGPNEVAKRGAVGRFERQWRVIALTARVIGALSLLAVGAVHLQQYEHVYSAIPTIGTLFLLNFVGATVIALGLVAPLEQWLGRWSRAALGLLALAGAGLAASAFVFLLIAERTPLFGFMEPGYDPPAIMAARVAELVTVAALGGLLAILVARRRAAGLW